MRSKKLAKPMIEEIEDKKIEIHQRKIMDKVLEIRSHLMGKMDFCIIIVVTKMAIK